MTNPWGRDVLSPERAVLLALSVQPQNAAAIAQRTGLPAGDVSSALQRLTGDSVAIREEDDYELTGPLVWFGDFAGALAHHARKNLLVSVPGEAETHLFLCDVRVKGGRPVGDPLSETVSVLACGRTVRDATGASGSGPTCSDCASASRYRANG